MGVRVKTRTSLSFPSFLLRRSSSPETTNPTWFLRVYACSICHHCQLYTRCVLSFLLAYGRAPCSRHCARSKAQCGSINFSTTWFSRWKPTMKIFKKIGLGLIVWLEKPKDENCFSNIRGRLFW